MTSAYCKIHLKLSSALLNYKETSFFLRLDKDFQSYEYFILSSNRKGHTKFLPSSRTWVIILFLVRKNKYYVVVARRLRFFPKALS